MTDPLQQRANTRRDGSSASVGIDAVARILEIACGQVRMPVALVAQTGEHGLAIRWKASGHAALPVPGDAVKLDAFLARVAADAVPSTVADATGSPGGLGSYVAVPVELSDGSTFGVLACLSPEPSPHLDEADTGVVRMLARAIARLIEQHDLRGPESRRDEIERIRRVLDGAGLSMVFQPIVDLDSRLPVGFEALARFTEEPARSPDRWFREAARVDLGADLELAAVTAALARLRDLPAGAFLSINASTQTAAAGAFLELLQGVDRGRVIVELTDHLSIQDHRALGRMLSTLGANGIRVATDVSDGGYASLSEVQQLMPDIVKLDGLLVRGLDRDPVRRALVASIAGFAAGIGAEVIGKSIETEPELEALVSLNVQSGQGNLLGAPGLL